MAPASQAIRRQVRTCKLPQSFAVLWTLDCTAFRLGASRVQTRRAGGQCRERREVTWQDLVSRSVIFDISLGSFGLGGFGGGPASRRRLFGERRKAFVKRGRGTSWTRDCSTLQHIAARPPARNTFIDSSDWGVARPLVSASGLGLHQRRTLRSLQHTMQMEKISAVEKTSIFNVPFCAVSLGRSDRFWGAST